MDARPSGPAEPEQLCRTLKKPSWGTENDASESG